MSRVAEIPLHPANGNGRPLSAQGERAAELISSPSSKSLLSLFPKWANGFFCGRRTNQPYLFSLPPSSDDDADNDEVVITAAAARSEPILTPGRSERGAPTRRCFKAEK